MEWHCVHTCCTIVVVQCEITRCQLVYCNQDCYVLSVARFEVLWNVDKHHGCVCWTISYTFMAIFPSWLNFFRILYTMSLWFLIYTLKSIVLISTCGTAVIYNIPCGTGTGVHGTGTGIWLHKVLVLGHKALVLDYWSTLYSCTKYWDARHWYWTSGPPCIPAQGSGTGMQGTGTGLLVHLVSLHKVLVPGHKVL